MARSNARQRTNVQPTPDTRLHGRPLVIGRVMLAILVILTLTLFILMLPAYFTRIQTVCASSVCVIGQPSRDTSHALRTHGLTLSNYAESAIVLTILVTLVCVVVAALIIRRRSDDWMALLVVLVLVMEGTTFVTYTLQWNPSAWQVPAFIMSTLSWGVIFLLFALFPDGRFVPGWTRWLVVGWIGCNIVAIFFPFSFFFNLFSNLIWLSLCACSMVSQIYRYRRVSGPVQRQQTKWIVYGTSVGIAAVIALEIPIFLIPSFGPGTLYSLVSWYGFMLALIPFPLSIGFAVQCSHLWDIDNIINRTLVYTILTALLVLAYFGGVALLQYLFRAFTGQASLLAVVGSTLAIAALFQPLRRYIQAIIDAFFYRRKYNTPQVLTDFDAKVRSCLNSCDEESLVTLTENVREIVETSLQPSRVSLWLYALELPKEASARAKEARQVSKMASMQLWEGQFGVLVNRVLIYGALAGIIALVCICILVIHHQLTQALPDQISELFIVGSILAVVMCFKPLRQRIQSIIDRRFYQHKYQAEQQLDEFIATLRHEVNVTQLREGLLEFVSEAMEPECVSLWLEEAGSESETPRYTGVLRQ